MRLFADAELAKRLESLAAAEMRRFVATARALDPTSAAASVEVAGGVGIFLEPGSPVNQAVGLGLAGPVDAAEVTALEAFFSARETRGLVVACPLAHPSLVARLSERSWVADGFENVLVREYEEGERFAQDADGIEVVEVADDEGRAVWAYTAAVGFSAPLAADPAQLALGRVVAARPGTRLFLALADGVPAGTGELYVEGGVAWLSADATLPAFRRRGVQRALQARRLKLGAESGCDLAVSEASPGSTSQRNMERAGFRVAYTRVDLSAPLAAAAPEGEDPCQRGPQA